MLTEKESKEIKLGRGGAREGAGRPPGAPNKLTRPVKELAAEQGSASIERLVQLRDDADSEQVRFVAAKELLDRAYGRARQEIDLTGDQSIMVIVQRQTPQPMGDVVPALPHHSANDGQRLNGTGSHDAAS